MYEKNRSGLRIVRLLFCILLTFTVQSPNAAPIAVTGPNTSQVLTVCYFQSVGNNQVPVKTTFYSTGMSPLLTLWRVKELNQACDATTPVARAEPIAFNLQSYGFTLAPNATSPKSVEIELLRAGMNEPFRTSVFMPNL